MWKTRLLLLAVSVTAIAMLTLAPPAAVAASRAAVTNGSCSGKSTWTLTLKLDNGRVEADMEMRTPKAGQRWRAAYRDNGVLFGRASKLTQPDGSWSATRFATNAAGTDHVVVRARNVSTGAVCRAVGTF